MVITNLYMWSLYILNAYVLWYIWGVLLGFKYQGKYKIIMHVTGPLVYIGFMYVVKMVVLMPDELQMILGLLFNTFYLILPFRGKLWRRVRLSVANGLFTILTEVVAVAMLSYVGLDKREVFYYGDANIYGLALTYLIYYMGIMFIVWGVFMGKKFFRGHLLFAILPLYQTFLAWTFLFSNLRTGVQVMAWGMVCSVFSAVLDVMVIWFLDGIIRRWETEEELTTLYRQRQYELEYYRSLNKQLEEMRRIRHDFQNRIQTVSLLLQKDKPEACLDAVEEMSILLKENRSGEGASLVNVTGSNAQKAGNPVLEAILELKRESADEKGIQMEMEIAPQIGAALGEVLNEVEICSLFGNLLDNAIEACEQVDRFQRAVYVCMLKKQGQLVIKCENACKVNEADRDSLWVSRKKRREEHGLGLRVMQRIVQDHGGTLEKRITGDRASVTIVL